MPKIIFVGLKTPVVTNLVITSEQHQRKNNKAMRRASLVKCFDE